MKKIIIAGVIILMFPISAMCSPFLVCDPQADTLTYQVTGDAFFTNPINAQADGSIRVDLAGIPSGVHNITVKACNVWDCSSTVPFSFAKQVPAAPFGIRLAP